MEEIDHTIQEEKISGVLAVLGKKIAENSHSFQPVPVEEIEDYFEGSISKEIIHMAGAGALKFSESKEKPSVKLRHSYKSTAREYLSEFRESGMDMNSYLKQAETVDMKVNRADNREPVELENHYWGDMGQHLTALSLFGADHKFREEHLERRASFQPQKSLELLAEDQKIRDDAQILRYTRREEYDSPAEMADKIDDRYDELCQSLSSIDLQAEGVKES
jgi:hypothetical protein